MNWRIKNIPSRIVIHLTLFIYLLLLSSNLAAISAPAPVARTGQNICYSATGDNVIIDCRGTGQDGELRAGKKWPSPRFTVGKDGTIVDELTGLEWSSSTNPTDDSKTWQEALDFITNLNRKNHLGYTDWRLPNISELGSLINNNPSDLPTWLSNQGFVNIKADYYWSSSTYAPYPSYVWSISMYGGIVAGRGKNDVGYIWPVRTGHSGALQIAQTGQTACYNNSGTDISCTGSGQDGEMPVGVPWPKKRFRDNGDQTITDSLTGLVWSQDAQTPGPSVCAPKIDKNHQEALDYIQCLNINTFLGRKNWRLPNRNELSSLINRGQINSAIWLDNLGFRNIQGNRYWSSTSYSYASWNAWNINLHDGAIIPVAKKIKANVWPVCNGHEQ